MIEQLGPTPLFVGVESQNWQLHDFVAAAQAGKALGVSSLLIKIADGANEWYGGIGGWQSVLSAVAQAGMTSIPYTYNYGNTYGAIQAEVNILVSAMHVCGIVIADMEAEFNGQVTWAEYMSTALKPISGLFGVTTWADPQQQAWGGVLQALSPCVNFWMPQVYSNNLAGMYHAQYDPYGLPYFPVVNLGTDFGDNAPIQIAKDSNSPIVGFWEYQRAIADYATVVKYIVATLQAQPQEVITMLQIDKFVGQYFTETVKDQRWHCIQTEKDISFALLNFYRSFGQIGYNGLSIFGLPLTGEIRVPNTNQAVIQICERGAMLYDPAGEVDKVPGVNGPCCPAHIDKGFVYSVLMGPSKPANLSQVVQSLNAMAALASQLKSDGDTLTSATQIALKALGQ